MLKTDRMRLSPPLFMESRAFSGGFREFGVKLVFLALYVHQIGEL